MNNSSQSSKASGESGCHCNNNDACKSQKNFQTNDSSSSSNNSNKFSPQELFTSPSFTLPIGTSGIDNPFSSLISFLQQINYFMINLKNTYDLIGISIDTFFQISQYLIKAFQTFEEKLRNSTFRLWLQRHCKQSKVFRYSLVLASVAISYHLTLRVKDYIKDLVILLFPNNSQNKFLTNN